MTLSHEQEVHQQEPVIFAERCRCILQDVHAVDFVILANRNPGAAVDNNRQQNYTLQLSGALTQEQILNRRAEAVAAFEQRNMQVRLSLK